MLNDIFTDKSLKPKEQIDKVARTLADGKLKISELIPFAEASKDPVKAGCIEALEFASKNDPKIISDKAFDFCVENLSAKAPRIKWESAKVIGNSAALHDKKLEKAVAALLINTEDKGTVVRWAAAYALGEIIN